MRNDECRALEDKAIELVETMMTADSLQLTAYGFGRMQRWKQAGAVSRCRFLTRWCGLFAVTPVYYHDNSRSTRKTALTLSLAGG